MAYSRFSVCGPDDARKRPMSRNAFRTIPTARHHPQDGLGSVHDQLDQLELMIMVVDLVWVGWDGLQSSLERLRCVWVLGDGEMKRRRASIAMVLEALIITTATITVAVSNPPFRVILKHGLTE